ncbi:MAG: glycosyltransferase [Planctomycetota bacterium]|nr:glycosyltransferase [Planctomycetota bacterium]
MKRIDHYATYLEGGAGAAAKRIFNGIVDASSHPQNGPSRPWELNLVCRDDQPTSGAREKHFRPSKSFLDLTLPRKLNRKSFRRARTDLKTHLMNRPREYETFSPARHYHPTALKREDRADLIHLHWVAFLFDYLTFFRSLPRSTPIVWTLHDMNAFTGGCHYSAGCEKYREGCGNCFQLDNPSADDLSTVSIQQKRKAYQGRNLTIVAPCDWLVRLAGESRVFPPATRFETIPYGLDTARYFPLEKSAAKEELGVLDQRINLLFAAMDLENPRKGISELKRSLQLLPTPENYRCLVFGNGELPRSELPAGLEIRQLGFLDSVEKVRRAYSAADVFLLPSLEDNLPQTGLESLACGTPVVAFGAGGIPEYVHHGKTGLLANVGSSSQLTKQITWLAQNRDCLKSFGQNGRELIVSDFEIEKQTRKYLSLYDQLLGRLPAHASKAG